jgi:hypothetical protein
MPEPIIHSFLNFLSKIFLFDAGTSEFYIMLSATLGVYLIVARLLFGLFGSDKGIVFAALGVAAPLLMASIAYVLIEWYALPQIDAAWAPLYLPWTGFWLLALGTALVVSRHAWGIGVGLTLLILLLSAAAAYGAYYGAQLTLDLTDEGSRQMEKREKRIDEQIELSQ